MSESSFEQAVKAHQAGDIPRARDLYQRSLAEQGDNAAVCNNLGLLDAADGRLEEARDWFSQALSLDPGSLDATTNLAQACIALDDAPGAAAHLEDLLGAMEPDAGERGELLSRIERFALSTYERGEREAAWRLSRLAAHADPDMHTATGILARCVRHIDPRSAPAEVREDLLLCLTAQGIDHRELAGTAARSLELSYRWIRQPPVDDLVATLNSTGLAHDLLLLALLEHSIVADPVLEMLLVQTRRALLTEWAQGSGLGADEHALLVAIALQCFSNEYLWPVSEEEKQMLPRTDAALTAIADDDDAADDAACRTLCLHACYAPLHTRADAAGLDRALASESAHWLGSLRPRLLLEPAREAELAGELEGEAPQDPTSRAVSEQYEHAPYPRWLSQEPQSEETVSEFLSALFPKLRPPAFLDRPVDILIAGCGTGEHAIRVARRHPRCRVTGIDLSRHSLAYGMRKAQEMRVTNLRFVQADILSLPDKAARYQVVESVGVLHHMGDPGQGLAALTEVLDPGGVLKLGLYARAARGGVRTARQRIQELGLTGTDDDMRALRQRILDGQEPSLKALTRSLDFYTLSNVRDLLFHVQEQQFQIPQLDALLRGAGLMLIGFQTPTSVRERYVARYPGDPWLQNLESLRLFEREHPGAFAGMYQFWCFKPPG